MEFHDAFALLLGDEGRGVPTILEMGTYTRLDCAIGSAGLMRHAVAEALHHAAHRQAFGRALIEQPLMKNVLADLAIDSEAATALAMRLARAFDRQDSDEEAALRRLLTPAVKYWICKRGPVLAAEAMEVLGGNGYVEESAMPRIYREMPVNSIWEGSGNVMCLDVLRALQKAPQALAMIEAELAAARGGNTGFDRFAAKLRQELRRHSRRGSPRPAYDRKPGARDAGRAARALRAAGGGGCVLRLAPRTRLGRNFSALCRAGTDFDAIIRRARGQ